MGPAVTHWAVRGRARSDGKMVATPEWRRQLKAALALKGRGSQQEAADFLKCDSAMITKLLNGKTASSTLIRPLSEFLHIPAPHAEVSTDEAMRLANIADELPADALRQLLSLAEFLASKHRT